MKPEMNHNVDISESAASLLSAAPDIASAGLSSVNGLARKASFVRILLAASAGSLTASLKRDLERMGHIVVEALSPLEAIASLGSRHPDLLITDLPFCTYAEGSVISVCRSTCPDCKIVLSTSWASELVGLCRESYDVDFILSSACRAQEVREVLNHMLKSSGGN